MLDENRRKKLAAAYRAAMARASDLCRERPDLRIEAPFGGLSLLEEMSLSADTAGPVGNPYGRLVQSLGKESSPEVRDRVLSLMRPTLVTTFSYAVPTDQALERIAALGDIVEVGAGGGYWARCLSDRGARVRAFDRERPADQRRKGGEMIEHHPVLPGGPAEALAAAPDADTLFLCWPPGQLNRAEVDAGAPPIYSTMAEEALARFTGRHVVFVGARTRSFGSPAFFARLDREWVLLEHLPLPHLGGWRDSVHIYRRR